MGSIKSVGKSKRWNYRKIKKLQFIEASYHTASDLDPEKTDFVLNLMTQRFNDSKRSFSLLYSNNYTFDAMLIAGYMLELSAKMTKIRRNEIDAKKMFTKMVYEKIKMMLTLPEEENKSKWEQSFQQQLHILEQCDPDVFHKKESILKNTLLSRE